MPNGYAYADSRRALRYRLTLLLHACDRPLSVAEMVAHLEGIGWPAPPPPNKSVSDSLRWEVARGRVRRAGRGRYTRGHLDRRTAWWMRHQLDLWESVERLSEFSEPVRTGRQPAVEWGPSVPAWLTAVRPDLAIDVERLSE